MRHVWVGLAVAGLAIPASAADLADLLRRVPAGMNTIAVLNVRAINKSPRAVKENWKDNHETEYLAGAMAVPPWAEVVVIAADLHPGALAHGRSLALFPVADATTAEAIAKRENGLIQSMADRQVVLSPRRGYIGLPALGVVGVSANMPRQEFAQWMRAAARPETAVADTTLLEAVAANRDGHIVVVANLQDMLDPSVVRTVMQQAGVNLEADRLSDYAKALASARRLVLTADIGDKTTSTLRVEFNANGADLLGVLRKVLPVALETAGVDIEEFKTADLKADGKAVVLQTTLSDRSLRRILSFVNAAGDSLSEGPSAIKTPKESAALAASLRYYRALSSAIDDLGTSRTAKGSDYVKSAALFDSYANKIEKLSLQNVDPALVQYGTSVVGKLHAMAGSLRGLKVQLDAFDNYKSGVWAGTTGWWGGGSVALQTNVPELSSRQAEAVAKLEPERSRLWSSLAADRSSVRREMLEKYKIDFEQYRK